jgi:uncharacterized membrane protein
MGVAVGIFLRLHNLGSESLWFDEGYTAWMVGHSPAQIIDLIRADTAPPLYYLLLHGWTECFGRSEAALRSLSAVFSILTLFIAIDIARKFLRNPSAIAIAAWVLAISFLQIWYAQEARAYALMGLLATLAFDMLLYHVTAKRRGWIVPLALVIAAGMYTHNMMAPYVMGLLIAWMILPSEHSTRRRLTEIAIVVAIALIFYLPWAIRGLPAQMKLIRHGFWVDRLLPGDFLSAIAALAGVKQYWSWQRYFDRVHLPIGRGLVPASICACLLVASGILSIQMQGSERRRQALGLLVMALFAPTVIALYSVARTPLFMEKIFLPSAVLLPIFVLLPLPMQESKAIWAGAWVFTAFCLLALCGHLAEDHKEDWRGAANFVSELPAERRLIVFVADDGQLPFDCYYRYRDGDQATGVPAGFFDLQPPRTMLRIPEDGDLAKLKARLDSGKFDQIVLIQSHQGWGDAQRLTETMLAKKYFFQGKKNLNDVVIQVYRP